MLNYKTPEEETNGIDVPPDWEIDYLFKIIEVVPTGVDRYDGEKPYFSTGSIQEDSISAENIYKFVNKPSRANRISRIGDVFQAKMQFTNKCVLIDEGLVDQLFSTGFIQLRPKLNNYCNELLYYYLQSPFFLKQRDEYSTGSTQVALTDTGLKRIKIPIPPKDVQSVIAKKLSSFIEDIKVIRKKTVTTKRIIQKFRQSVLSAAVAGKLTKKWRERNSVNFEWQELKLKELVEKHGIFDGPFGSNLKTSDYTEHGVRVIRLENIGFLNFIESKRTYVSETKYQGLVRHTVGEGDVIFASFIAEGVRVVVLPPLETKAIAKADCFCIRVNPKMLNKEYLCYALSSSDISQQLALHIHGATRPRINTTQLKETLLPIPTVVEQQEIVRQVKSMFEIADLVEDQIEIADKRTDKLTQSILAKAFRGEL